MVTPDFDFDETGRLAAVRRYEILDTPPDGAFDRVCRLATRLFDVPIATVTIVDEDRIWFKACEGLDAVEVSRAPGLCASAILQAEPYIVNDGLTDPRTAANPLVHGEPGVRFYAAAAITTSDGHRLGTVNVIDTKPREATDGDKHALQELAAVVMDELELRLAAIREVQRERERRERAQQERRQAETLARILQRSLLPERLPELPGLTLAARYLPGVAGVQVGGDWYDVIALPDDRVGVAIGDVTGRGVRAAASMGQLRMALRACAVEESSPAAVVQRVNRLACQLLPGEMATLVYLVLDPPAGALRLVNAGHPPPLLVPAGGDAMFLEDTPSPLLGHDRSIDYREREVALEPAATLLLYTDGLVDRKDLSIIDGMPRLRAAASTAAADVETLCENVIATLLPDGPTDDVALLALRATRP